MAGHVDWCVLGKLLGTKKRLPVHNSNASNKNNVQQRKQVQP